MRRVVVALGGNALCRRGERITTDLMRRRVAETAAELASVCRRDELVLTHGNGPQVGFLAMQAEALGGDVAPLDVLGAESEGMIGFLIEEALASQMPEREVAVLLTQVVVDRRDPAFGRPQKPIGPLYGDEAEARRLARERGWTVGRDGLGFRRLVASPEPQAVRELQAIRSLLAAAVVVVCAGGGGIPVIADAAGVRGIAAVVDKDLTASLLAVELGADALVLLTDVPGIYRDWPAREGLLTTATVSTLRAQIFAEGSMAPKVEAACRFAERTGKPAFIGALGSLAAIFERSAGTRIER